MMIFFPMITPPVMWACLGIYGFLIIFQIIFFLGSKWKPNSKFSDMNARLRAWWYIFIAFTLVFLTRVWVLDLFWMGISLLALREYFHVIPINPEHKRTKIWLYLSIPLQYACILLNWYGLFLIFIPVYIYFLFPIRMILSGSSKHFLQSLGGFFWGVMMTGYSLSYVAYLSHLAIEKQYIAGPLGLLLYLLFITEMNDAMQYLWGKSLGRHLILPKISPKKTIEGLIGGVLSSICFSLLIAPFLTPMNWVGAILMGGLISIGGFFGDVTFSAIKRDVHIKDFGKLLPGHGGLLDRIDSLIFTAPLFFHLIRWFY
ncbi:MAG: Phosphatidate cytidylyltransferase [Candidatus Anoxychlamydiales bacterium]|nr:Phosphatidate cytidylyltransferase [Candidatus Anoxychlamydiales bacterium]